MKSTGAQDHEQKVLFSDKGMKTASAASGQNGMFTKAFVGGQPTLDEFRIVWPGKEVDLKAALAESALLGVKNRGLAHGHGGLGV